MAYDLYLLLESSVYTKISGVVSETIENVNLFDSSTYRDEPNASYLGSPPITIGQSQSILGDSVTPVFDGVVGVGGGSVTNTTLEFTSAVGTNTVFNTGNNSYFDKCDSITHTEPRKWEKTRTDLEAELQAARSSERNAIIENSLMTALSKHGVTEEGIDLLPDRLASRIQFKLADGRRVITIMQPDGETGMIGTGTDGRATYDDLVKEAMNKWPSLFKSAGVGGSGATPTSSNGGAAKITTKADLADRPKRLAFIKANGPEAYDALPPG